MSIRNDILLKERQSGVALEKLSSFELAIIQEPTDHVTFDGMMWVPDEDEREDEEDQVQMQALGVYREH
jgi:hypothetical protein